MCIRHVVRGPKFEFPSWQIFVTNKHFCTITHELLVWLEPNFVWGVLLLTATLQYWFKAYRERPEVRIPVMSDFCHQQTFCTINHELLVRLEPILENLFQCMHVIQSVFASMLVCTVSCCERSEVRIPVLVDVCHQQTFYTHELLVGPNFVWGLKLHLNIGSRHVNESVSASMLVSPSCLCPTWTTFLNVLIKQDVIILFKFCVYESFIYNLRLRQSCFLSMDGVANLWSSFLGHGQRV